MGVEEAFFDAERDPFSIIFGLHHILIDEPKWSVVCIQTALAMIVLITAPLASTANTYFEQRCCYVDYPPSASTFVNHGACNDASSLANVQSDGGACVHAVPTTQVLLTAAAIVAAIANVCIYLHNSAEYRHDVRNMLKRKSKLKTSTRLMMAFPFSGFLLGTYEKITKFSVLYHVRLLLLFSLVGVSIAAYVQRILNIAWGCYAAGVEVSFGRCDTVGSAIYMNTNGGHASVWESTLILWCVLTLVFLVWIMPWYLRFIGWPPRIDSLADEFTELLQQFIVHREEFAQTGLPFRQGSTHRIP